MQALKQLRQKRAQLRQLQNKRIRVQAVGNYPDKNRTRVADVAVYQNDGTDRITPSRFVERAAASAGDWQAPLHAAVTAFLHGRAPALQKAGDQMAKDIGIMCDRIRTGQLKASFRAVVINEP